MRLLLVLNEDKGSVITKVRAVYRNGVFKMDINTNSATGIYGGDLNISSVFRADPGNNDIDPFRKYPINMTPRTRGLISHSKSNLLTLLGTPCKKNAHS